MSQGMGNWAQGHKSFISTLESTMGSYCESNCIEFFTAGLLIPIFEASMIN